MHPKETDLRAYLDHELAERRYQVIGEHLQHCERCHARLAELSRRAGFAAQSLSALDAGQALPSGARVRARLNEKKETPTMRRSIFPRSRLAWAAMTLLVVLIASFSFPSVRAFAGQVLGLFRVQQVKVLPVNIDRIKMYGDSTMAQQLATTMADSITFTKEPGESRSADSPVQASEMAGFTVRAPSGQTPQMIEVQDSLAFEFTFDRELAQAFLEDSGRADLVLPAALENAKIGVEMPAGVSLFYGSCDKVASPEMQPAGQPCTVLLQMPSPTVSTPPGVELSQLAELGLQFTGMSAEDARSLSETIDWNSTLVVPIPMQSVSYKTVTVDGAQASLIHSSTDPDDGQPHYILLWVKDGIVYSLVGNGNSADGIALANSLQ